MRTRSTFRLLVAVAVVGAAVFAAITVVVVSEPHLAIDQAAFDVANDVRAQWLNHAARVVTTLGLIGIVAPVVLIAAALLARRRHRRRASAVVAGAALAWASAWITKVAVDRPRPPAPLVHTTGQTYPSAHAANSVAWLAVAIALSIFVSRRAGRTILVAAGAAITVLVGLSRVYLRAHYASDVAAGYALAATMYALAAIGALIVGRSRRSQPDSRRTVSDDRGGP